LIIANKVLEIEINKPGENYKGSRFDWTGNIAQICFGKNTFCTEETQDPDLINSSGRGLYNESGIDEPIGYDDCPVGDKFLKIGVGFLLRDSDEKYNFFKPYIIEPAETETNIHNHSADFISQTRLDRGYACKLSKSVVLDGSSFSIIYSLENTGEKTITTHEYVHNFLSINRKDVNGDYVLKFPFQISENNFRAFVNPQNVIKVNMNTIIWNNIPSGDFFISHLEAPALNTTSWTLENCKEKCGIRESVNFQVLRINLWGTKHVISPEIFYPINLLPGKTLHWQRHYELFNK
jgi:hypothetical protein